VARPFRALDYGVGAAEGVSGSAGGMGITRRLGGRALAATAASVSVVALASAGAAPGSCDTAEVRQGPTGTWTIYTAPRFPSGDGVVTNHAVDPAQPNRWFITNGTAIMASQDGGCTWQTSYEVPESASAEHPLDRANGRNTALSAGGDHVLATVTGPQERVPAISLNGGSVPEDGLTTLVRSADNGATWRDNGVFVNEGGGPGPLVQARSDPDRVYLATGGSIRTSRDGGATFSTPSPLTRAEVDIQPVVKGIAVDPGEPNRLIARTRSGLYYSDNAGLSYETYDFEQSPWGPTVRGPAWALGDAEAGRVLLTQGGDFEEEAGVDQYWISDNGGIKFEAAKTDDLGRMSGDPTSMAGGSRPRDIVVTTDTHPRRGVASLYRWQPALERFVEIDHELGPLSGAQPDREADAAFHFFQARKLVKWEIDAGALSQLTPPPPPARRTQSEDEGDDSEPPPAPDELKGRTGTLEPDGGKIRVEPGTEAVVDYRYVLPARPNRLDTFFLLDTSGSTEPYIKAIAGGLQSLAENLNDLGIDARFGLGEYQDVFGVRYRRRADIRTVDDYLIGQIGSIRTNGGAEPGYTAIHQAVTGSGIDAPANGEPVPPGRNAHWRKSSGRLILHVADEAFSDDPSGADRDATVAALKEAGAHFIGIVVPPAPIPTQVNETCDLLTPVLGPEATASPESSTQLLCQLTDLARQTGTFAPAGGVDCNGDGVIDVPEGKPLACVVDSNRLDGLPAGIERLQLQIPLKQPISLRAADGSEIKVTVTPGGDYAARDLFVDQDLEFKAAFTCTEEQRGKEFPTTIQALVGELVATETKPTIVCGEPPETPAPVVGPVKKPAKQPPPAKQAPDPAIVAVVGPGPVVVPAAAPQPPPPPARVPAPAPLGAAQGQVSAQASGQAQATQVTPGQVGAAQQQQEAEVAFQTVRVEDGPPEAEALNFSPAAHQTPGDWPWLIRTLGMAGVLGVAGAAAARRSRREARRAPARRRL
jgi:hypothetical protein